MGLLAIAVVIVGTIAVAGYFGSSHGSACRTVRPVGPLSGQGLDPRDVLPVGPSSNVTTRPYPGAVGDITDTVFILGGDDCS